MVEKKPTAPPEVFLFESTLNPGSSEERSILENRLEKTFSSSSKPPQFVDSSVVTSTQPYQPEEYPITVATQAEGTSLMKSGKPLTERKTQLLQTIDPEKTPGKRTDIHTAQTQLLRQIEVPPSTSN